MPEVPPRANIPITSHSPSSSSLQYFQQRSPSDPCFNELQTIPSSNKRSMIATQWSLSSPYSNRARNLGAQTIHKSFKFHKGNRRWVLRRYLNSLASMNVNSDQNQSGSPSLTRSSPPSPSLQGGIRGMKIAPGTFRAHEPCHAEQRQGSDEIAPSVEYLLPDPGEYFESDESCALVKIFYLTIS